MRIDPWGPAQTVIGDPPKFNPDPRVHFNENPLTYTEKKRLAEGRNTMNVFTGEPRSGKTNGATALCEELSLRRPLRAKDITFTPVEYITKLDKGQFGDAIEFDEPGAEWNSRNFMSAANKMLNATHVTFGSKGITVAWALPVFTMQDVGARMLAKYYFEMVPWGRKGRARFYFNWVSHYSGHTGRTRIGGIQFMRAWQDRPEEQKEYDEMKKQYQDKSYAKYVKELSKGDDPYKDKDEEIHANIKKAVELIVKDPTAYLNQRGKVDPRYLSKSEFHLSQGDAAQAAHEANIILAQQKKAP